MERIHKTVMLSKKVHDHAKSLAEKSYNGNFSLALDKLAERGMRNQKKEDGANMQ